MVRLVHTSQSQWGAVNSSSTLHRQKVNLEILATSPTPLYRVKMAALNINIKRGPQVLGFCIPSLQEYYINNKYSDELAAEALEWISDVTSEQFNKAGDQDNFHDVLKDGVVLCKVINSLKPGHIKKIQTSTMAFKCMENINQFLEGAKSCGVPTEETFQTVDLWERQNLNSVVICIHSLGRKGSKFDKPSIGPKESKKNVRTFTEEQLKASEGVISLQYGTNKGASQTGMSFGNTRHM